MVKTLARRNGASRAAPMRRFLLLAQCPLFYAPTVRLYLTRWIPSACIAPLVAQPAMLVGCERWFSY